MDFFKEKLDRFNILLGSKSPRRRNLLRDTGISFKILPAFETDESYPEDMSHEEVPIFISKKKALAYKHYIIKNTLLITADTIVSLNGEILGKPNDNSAAKIILKKLSGKCHRVISGVSLTSMNKQISFKAITEVYFKDLTDEEIEYYIDLYKPLDKAGAYGIQEWIGYIGIKKITGSFYNVMGLPIQKLYSELLKF